MLLPDKPNDNSGRQNCYIGLKVTQDDYEDYYQKRFYSVITNINLQTHN